MENNISADISIEAANGYSLIVVTYELKDGDTGPDYLEIDAKNKLTDLSPLRFTGKADAENANLIFNVYLKYTGPTLRVTFGFFDDVTPSVPCTLTPTKADAVPVDGSFIGGNPNDAMIVLDSTDTTTTGSFVVTPTKIDGSILHITSKHFSHVLTFLSITSNKSKVYTLTEPTDKGDPEFVHFFLTLSPAKSNTIIITPRDGNGGGTGITDLAYDYGPNEILSVATLMLINPSITTGSVISPYVRSPVVLMGDRPVDIGIPPQNTGIQYYCVLQAPPAFVGGAGSFPKFSSVGSSDGQSKRLDLSNTSLPIDYSKFGQSYTMKAYTVSIDVEGNILLSAENPFIVAINSNDPPTPQQGTLTVPALSAHTPIVNNNVDDASPLLANATLGYIQAAAPTATAVIFAIYIRGYKGGNQQNDIITAQYTIDVTAAAAASVTATFDTNKLKGYDSTPLGSPSKMQIQYRVISDNSEQLYSKIAYYDLDTEAPFVPLEVV